MVKTRSRYTRAYLLYNNTSYFALVYDRYTMELQHPFSMLIAGGRKAGKTEFTKKPLKSEHDIINPPPERIVWCYSKHQPELYDELMNINSSIEYMYGIPSDLDTAFDRTKKNLVVLDDMMDEASKDEKVAQLFTRGRHDNLSVIYLTQNLFHKNQRSISLNSDYMVIFKNPRDRSQIQHLARQFMPINSKFLTWAYEDATQKPFSYLLLDLTPSMDDRHRVRTDILPEQYSQIIYMSHK